MTRFDGWKSIGAYFGRDRTTAIRWAKDRGLPVRKVPGGRTATVYALKDDLDEWLARAGPTDAETSSGTNATAGDTNSASLTAEALALYIEARDHWAQRTAGSIDLAIAEFERLIDIAPDFAPGLVGLAEARMAASDYGTLSEEQSYGSAARLVRQALAIDPLLVDAHRALGLIAYWWEHDPANAARHFWRAIEIDPSDAQTRFWFAGALSDNGEFDAALIQFNESRRRQPGSLPVQTHLALLRWHTGDRDDGIRALEEITVRYPTFPLGWYFLGLARLGEGLAEAWLETVHKRAELRGEARQMELAASLQHAWDRGGGQDLMVSAAQSHMEIEAQRPYPDHALAAVHASLSGEEILLEQVLQQADANRETWGSYSLVQRMKARHAADPKIVALIQKRTAPRMAG